MTTGLVQLFVRFGLSPDLYDLLQFGQSHLSAYRQRAGVELL